MSDTPDLRIMRVTEYLTMEHSWSVFFDPEKGWIETIEKDPRWKGHPSEVEPLTDEQRAEMARTAKVRISSQPFS